MKIDKIIVFGSNSFAGRSFVKYCLECKYHVTATSRSKETKKPFRIYNKAANKNNFKYIKFDINNNIQRKNIFNYIEKKKIKIIIDFSSQSMVGESWEKPEDWIRTNCFGKLKLIENLPFAEMLLVDLLPIFGRVEIMRRLAYIANAYENGNSTEWISMFPVQIQLLRESLIMFDQWE
jgi:dTDP-4-dehydrorhamnose reductase